MATWKHIIDLETDEIIKHVKDDFAASEEHRRPINARNLMRLKTFYALDLSEPIEDPPISTDNNPMYAMLGSYAEKMKTNAFYPPFARGMVLAYKAQLKAALFSSNEEWLQVIAKEQMDESAAEAFGQLANFLYREIDYLSEADLAIIQALVMDVSVIYTGWVVEPDTVPVIKSNNVNIPRPNGEPVSTNIPEEKKIVQFEYRAQAKSMPDIWTVNTFNWRYDPSAVHGSLNRSNPLFVGVTQKMNKAEFYRRAESGMFSEIEYDAKKKKDKLKVKGVEDPIPEDEPCGGQDGDDTEDYDNILYSQMGLNEDDTKDKDINHVRLDMYWQKFAHVIVLNGKYLIHKEKKPGWSFHLLRSYQLMGRLSGRPLMDDLIQIQHDITGMTRSRRNRQDDDVYGKKMVDMSYFKSYDAAYAAVAGSDQIVLFDGSDIDSKYPPVSFLEHTQPFHDTLEEEKFEMYLAEWVTGLSQNRVGVDRQGGRRTATEAMERAQGSETRSDEMVKTFRKALVQGVTYDLWMLLQMYSTQEWRFRVAGTPGGFKYVKYTTEDFLFNTPPEIRVISQSQIDEMMTDAQIFMNALSWIMSNPIMAQYVKLSPALFRLSRKMGIENPEEWLNTDKPVDFIVPPEFEIKGLIHGIDVPISQLSDPKEHYEAINEFVASSEFDDLDDNAQQRITRRGDEYKQIIEQGGQQGAAGGTPLGGPMAAAMGGLMTGGSNAGGSPNPAANQAAGQVNRMAAGPVGPGGG